MKRTLSLIAIVFILWGIQSCTKEFEGDRDAQTAPETYAVVDSIKRDSSNLLVTTVTGFWWGHSPAGFIAGYEVSTDGQQTWTYTKNQSGSFLLSLPFGSSKGELPIYIRAIDNLGQKDPTPARMVFPVKNSNPKIVFDFISNKRPLKSFPIIKLAWTTTDIDGIADIDRFELFLNDTNNTAFAVPGTTKDATISDSIFNSSVRIEGRVSGGVFQPECNVYTGSKITPLAGTLPGMVYNSWNYIYLRAIDRTGNKSAMIKDSIWIKRPASDFLIVNALVGSASSTFSFYANQLKNIGGNLSLFDTLIGITTQFYNDELYNDAVTQSRTFSLFKNIIWLTDDANSLATCQQNTGEFFNNGGSMFIVTEISNDFPFNSEVFGFTPVASLVVPPPGGNIRMNVSELVTPYATGGWPLLKSTAILSNSRPFYTLTTSSGLYSYDSIYRANLINQTTSGTTAWTGPSNVMSKRKRVSSGKSDLIFFSLPLHRLNGNNNVDSLFRKVLIDELGF